MDKTSISSSNSHFLNPSVRGISRKYSAVSFTSSGSRSVPGSRIGSPTRAMASNNINPSDMKIVTGEAGYVLEDVPHLRDYIPDLPTYPNPLQHNPAYSVVKQYFVDMDDSVPQKIVVHKDTARGIHFRRAGPRQKVYFESDEVHACIVTCGGLCPGLNTVIRELVCGLYHMYGVKRVLGIDLSWTDFMEHINAK